MASLFEEYSFYTNSSAIIQLVSCKLKNVLFKRFPAILEPSELSIYIFDGFHPLKDLTRRRELLRIRPSWEKMLGYAENCASVFIFLDTWYEMKIANDIVFSPCPCPSLYSPTSLLFATRPFEPQMRYNLLGLFDVMADIEEMLYTLYVRTGESLMLPKNCLRNYDSLAWELLDLLIKEKNDKKLFFERWDNMLDDSLCSSCFDDKENAYYGKNSSPHKRRYWTPSECCNTVLPMFNTFLLSAEECAKNYNLKKTN